MGEADLLGVRGSNESYEYIYTSYTLYTPRTSEFIIALFDLEKKARPLQRRQAGEQKRAQKEHGRAIEAQGEHYGGSAGS